MAIEDYVAQRQLLYSDGIDDYNEESTTEEFEVEEVEEAAAAALEEEEEQQQQQVEGEREESVDESGSRMETTEDVTMEVQSGEMVSSSPNCKSVKLQTSDILDCPTCYEPLKSPIYQCNNGHLACSSCCTKLERRCSFCRSDIGDIRCRAMEMIIESTIVPCQNAIYGCTQTTTYGGNQLSHEKRCIFIRCSCPSPNCTYIGSYSDLKLHARDAHSWYKVNYKFFPFVFDEPVIFGLNLGGKKMAIFQEEDEGDLIVIQASKGSNGMYVTVSCIAPPNPGVSNLSCSLTKLGDLCTLKVGLMVKKIQKVREEEVPQDSFILIPSYMLSNENCTMQICIGRESKYVHI